MQYSTCKYVISRKIMCLVIIGAFVDKPTFRSNDCIAPSVTKHCRLIGVVSH
jgi:hypothetical protein